MTNADATVECLRRWTLLLGVLQVMVGCLVGMTPPDAVPWFRGIVMAHIEFTINGILVVVLGLLLREMRLGRTALYTWFAALQLGSWTNGGAGVAAALLGQSSRFMPTINQKFPPPVAVDHPLPSGLLMVCGVAILLALFLSLWGLWRGRRPA